MQRWKPLILTGGVFSSALFVNNKLANLISTSNQTKKSQIDPLLVFTRNFRTLLVVGTVSLDYIINGRNTSKDLLHERSARRLTYLAAKNRGIYIKVAQHAAALDYLLPIQYTDAFKVFQNRAPQSSFDEIKEVICEELKLNDISNLFSYFDPDPVGSASLAQVHLAILKDSRQHVAVKVQHKEIRKSADFDRVTIKYLVKLNSQLFPNFRFDWLNELIETNLPVELNFKREGRNSEIMSQILKKYNTNIYKTVHPSDFIGVFTDLCSRLLNLAAPSLAIRINGNKNRNTSNQAYKNEEYRVVFSIPKIFWEHSTKRVLVMEQCHGSKITESKALEHKNIIKLAIADSLSKLFFGMIFKEDYIHVDPHPGNILVNIIDEGASQKSGRSSILLTTLEQAKYFPRHKIEISLLDHGLYCETSSLFRAHYADLWTSIIEGDENLLKSAAHFFKIDENYKTLASMVSGRVKESIEKGLKNIENSASEKDLFRKRAAENVTEINRLLQSMPNDLIMVLKTNDLIRNILNTLELDEAIALVSLASSALTISHKNQKPTRLDKKITNWAEYYSKIAFFSFYYWLLIKKYQTQS